MGHCKVAECLVHSTCWPSYDAWYCSCLIWVCNSETHLAFVDMVEVIDKPSKVKLQKIMKGKDHPKWSIIIAVNLCNCTREQMDSYTTIELHIYYSFHDFAFSSPPQQTHFAEDSKLCSLYSSIQILVYPLA